MSSGYTQDQPMGVISGSNRNARRRLRQRNERVKRAAIAAIGANTVPRYRAKKSPTNAKKAAIRAAKLARKQRVEG